jgi:uncharacterized protein YcfL
MKKLCFPFLAILAAVLLVACGAASTTSTKQVELGEGQEVTMRSIGSQPGPVEVKVIFTVMGSDDAPVFYFQAFTDGELMGVNQFLYGYDLFQGLHLAGKISTQQLVIEYDPKLWEAIPSK